MAESAQNQTPAQASFVEHLRAFHAGLPPEEQALLEQVLSLAQSAEQGDVQGFVNIIETNPVLGLVAFADKGTTGLAAAAPTQPNPTRITGQKASLPPGS